MVATLTLLFLLAAGIAFGLFWLLVGRRLWAAFVRRCEDRDALLAMRERERVLDRGQRDAALRELEAPSTPAGVPYEHQT